MNQSCVVAVVLVLLGVWSAGSADVVFQDDFTGPLTWTTSDGTTYIVESNFLYIGSGLGYDDYAQKTLHVALSAGAPVVIEQRTKLASGGLNYRLPQEWIFFEDSSDIRVTYLPTFGLNQDGWEFGYWTHSDEHAVPGSGYWTSATADYWAVTRMVLTPSGGELFVKPDDADKGWFSEKYYSVATNTWSHSSIEAIRFAQPWDSVNYVDYVRVKVTPEPATLSLLALGALALIRRGRSARARPVV